MTLSQQSVVDFSTIFDNFSSFFWKKNSMKYLTDSDKLQHQ